MLGKLIKLVEEQKKRDDSLLWNTSDDPGLDIAADEMDAFEEHILLHAWME